MKFVLISFFCSTLFFANETSDAILNSSIQKQSNTFSVDINELNSLPKSIKRDFLINEYLKEDITSQQAYETLFLMEKMRLYTFFNFAKKYGHDETLAVSQCINMQKDELVNSYADCIVNGLNIKKASSFSPYELQQIIDKSKSKYPDFAKKVSVLHSAIPFTKLIIQKKESFYDIFLGVDKSFRQKYFNYKLPKGTLRKILADTNSFEDLLQTTLNDPKMDILNGFLNGIDSKKFDCNTTFLLALNAIRIDDFNSAYIYLEDAKRKSNTQEKSDKIDFWIYLLTKNIEVLKALSQSSSINFYSLYAKELLKEEINPISLQISEVFATFIKELEPKKAALLYSIIKTKSNFDANFVSDDFTKVGIAFLNPNIIKNLLKTEGKEYNVNNLFDEKLNLDYAKLYIDNLNLELNNPLDSYLKYLGVENITLASRDLLQKFINFEAIKDRDKEQFILYYYFYINSLKSTKKIELSTIF